MKKPPRKKKVTVKKPAMKVRKKIMKKRSTRASPLASSATKYTIAATNQPPASKGTKSIVSSKRYDQAQVALELDPDTDIWVIISNVHESAASESLIRALFEKCGQVTSQSFQFDSRNLFQGTIYAAFARRDDAKEAVSLYHNNVTLFGRTWGLQLWGNYKRKRTRLSEAGSSSSTSRQDSSAVSSRSVSYHLRSSTLAAGASESLSSVLSDAVRTMSLQDAAADIGVSAKVRIFNIDARVPSDFIKLLFERGRLRSCTINLDPSRQVEGTAQLVYERSEDAVAAVKQFSNNVNLFGSTWRVELSNNDIFPPPGTGSLSRGKGKQKIQ